MNGDNLPGFIFIAILPILGLIVILAETFRKPKSSETKISHDKKDTQ